MRFWFGIPEVITEAQTFDCDLLVSCFLQLNYAKCCTDLNRQDDCIKIYNDIIKTINELHKNEDPSNESIKLLAFANFNLGVHYQELIAEPDPTQAAHYLREAIAIFESRVVPTPEYDEYYGYATERLRIIEE